MRSTYNSSLCALTALYAILSPASAAEETVDYYYGAFSDQLDAQEESGVCEVTGDEGESVPCAKRSPGEERALGTFRRLDLGVFGEGYDTKDENILSEPDPVIVYFDRSEALLNQSSKDRLNLVCEAVSQLFEQGRPISKFKISGHVDSSVETSVQSKLSKQRAVEVAEYLKNSEGCGGYLNGIIVTRRYRAARPLSEFKSDRAAPEHNRVEFEVTNR